MANFKGQFTRIKDLSDRRRLPRLGKIRLGKKLVSTTSGKEYPKDTSFFVCPPEVSAVYGAEPTELDVMLPLNDPEAIFPQRYIWYGQSRGAKCMGDGEKAVRLNEGTGEMEERSCPCEQLGKNCSERAHLLVILPKVNVGGVYQIDMGSYHSIVDINSGLAYIEALVGRIAMVPLKLRRVPRETHGSGRKEIHYTLQIVLEGDINFINSLRESTTRILAAPKMALPAPEIENPATDPEAVVETVEDNEPDPFALDPEQSDFPTEAEALEDAKKAGLVQEEKQAQQGSPDDQKAAWRKELDGLIRGLQTYTDIQSLNRWFVDYKKKGLLPEAYVKELGVAVTERLRQMSVKTGRQGGK